MTIIFEHDPTREVPWKAHSPSLPEATAEGLTREFCETSLRGTIKVLLEEKAARVKELHSELRSLQIHLGAFLYEIEDYAKQPVNFEIRLADLEKDVREAAAKITSAIPRSQQNTPVDAAILRRNAMDAERQ